MSSILAAVVIVFVIILFFVLILVRSTQNGHPSGCGSHGSENCACSAENPNLTECCEDKNN
jgi:uncharacterized membrane protein